MKQLPSAGETSVPDRPTVLDLRRDPSPDETTLTLAQAAARLGVDKTTVLRYIQQGKLKGFKTPGLRGEQWQIPVSELAKVEVPNDPEPPASTATVGEGRVLEQLMTTMERLVTELSTQRLQLTAGEQRISEEREARARLEERLVAADEMHRLELEAARIAAQNAAEAALLATQRATEAAQQAIDAERERVAAAQAAREEAEAQAAALRVWAETAKRRRFRKPPPPPGITLN